MISIHNGDDPKKLQRHKATVAGRAHALRMNQFIKQKVALALIAPALAAT
nr:hypothetical protein [uncultured Albidiferax sp.]